MNGTGKRIKYADFEQVNPPWQVPYAFFRSV